MLKVKRQQPPVMLNAEKRIEQWRSALLEDIHTRLDVAIFLLVSSTCHRIGDAIGRLMPRYASELETLTRGQLFGLQFALSGLNGDLPHGRFIEALIADSLSPQEVRRAYKAIEHMYAYSLARDVFLTYAWGGYEIDNSTENILRFADSPDWRGGRDRAEQIISQEIKEDQARSFGLPIVYPFELVLERSVDVPPSLPLADLTSAQFVSAWMGLASHFLQSWLSGHSPVMEKESIVAMVQSLANLSADEAERFVSLVAFERKGSSALTLFHCPLVPVTTTSVLAVSPGFIFGNPTACIPRLAVHRGPGLNAYAKAVEAHFLEKLRSHFHIDRVTINTNLPYSWQDDCGDIDFVLYEPTSNRLLVAMVKAFIIPDTVEEIVRANQALEEGIRQAERARRWLENLPFTSWANTLNIALCSTPPRVQFTVIGNGFAGSDYLPIPQDIAVVDGHYLLLSRFARKSIFDAVDAYQKRLAEESTQAVDDLSFNSVKLADITIEFPSWSIAI